MRILAVDYGDVRTGIAVSDPSGLIPGETTTVTAYTPEKVCNAVCELIVRYKADRVVVGKPLNMNGTAGERAEKACAFAKMLEEASGVETIMWDERQTSVTANRILSDAGKKRGKQRERVDAVAASIILQAYLDFLRMRG